MRCPSREGDGSIRLSSRIRLAGREKPRWLPARVLSEARPVRPDWSLALRAPHEPPPWGSCCTLLDADRRAGTQRVYDQPPRAISRVLSEHGCAGLGLPPVLGEHPTAPAVGF